MMRSSKKYVLTILILLSTQFVAASQDRCKEDLVTYYMIKNLSAIDDYNALLAKSAHSKFEKKCILDAHLSAISSKYIWGFQWVAAWIAQPTFGSFYRVVLQTSIGKVSTEHVDAVTRVDLYRKNRYCQNLLQQLPKEHPRDQIQRLKSENVRDGYVPSKNCKSFGNWNDQFLVVHKRQYIIDARNQHLQGNGSTQDKTLEIRSLLDRLV